MYDNNIEIATKSNTKKIVNVFDSIRQMPTNGLLRLSCNKTTGQYVRNVANMLKRREGKRYTVRTLSSDGVIMVLRIK